MSKAKDFLERVKKLNEAEDNSFDELSAAWDEFTKLAKAMIKKASKDKQKKADSLFKTLDDAATKFYNSL